MSFELNDASHDIWQFARRPLQPFASLLSPLARCRRVASGSAEWHQETAVRQQSGWNGAGHCQCQWPCRGRQTWQSRCLAAAATETQPAATSDSMRSSTAWRAGGSAHNRCFCTCSEPEFTMHDVTGLQSRLLLPQHHSRCPVARPVQVATCRLLCAGLQRQNVVQLLKARGLIQETTSPDFEAVVNEVRSHSQEWSRYTQTCCTASPSTAGGPYFAGRPCLSVAVACTRSSVFNSGRSSPSKQGHYLSTSEQHLHPARLAHGALLAARSV